MKSFAALLTAVLMEGTAVGVGAIVISVGGATLTNVETTVGVRDANIDWGVSDVLVVPASVP